VRGCVEEEYYGERDGACFRDAESHADSGVTGESVVFCTTM
jgi:hypothetical protein